MFIKYFLQKMGITKNNLTKKTVDNVDVLKSKEKTVSVYYTEPLSYQEVRANSVPLKHNPFLSRHIPNKVHEYRESMPIEHGGYTGNDSINKKQQSSQTSQIDNTLNLFNVVNTASNISERCEDLYDSSSSGYSSSSFCD